MLKTTRTYLEALTHGLTDEKVKFVEGKDWHTDIEKKIITYNPLDLINKPFIFSKGLILHELSHVKYTHTDLDSDIAKKYPDAMQQVYNAFEDCRIESKSVTEYGDYSKEGFLLVNETLIDRVHEQQEQALPKKAPKLKQFLLRSMIDMDMSTLDMSWNFYSNNSYLTDEDVKERAEKIRDMKWSMLDMKTTDELKTYIDEKVFPIIKDWIEEQQKEEDKKPKQGKGQPQGAQSKKQQSTCSKSVNVKASLEPKENNRTGEIPTDAELSGLLAPYIRTLAQKLSDILKEQQSTRFTGNYLRGKLLSRNAYKVMIPDTTRIFSKKNTPNKPNYTITFLLDESGSMQGKKHADAYMSAFLLHEVSKKLDFKINVFTYDRYTRKVPLTNYRTIGRSGTDDYQAWEEVKKHLDLSDENIVFVLTDGATGATPVAITDELVRKGVIILGVGIGLSPAYRDQLKTYYRTSVVVPNTTDLPEVMINQLAKMIHR